MRQRLAGDVDVLAVSVRHEGRLPRGSRGAGEAWGGAWTWAAAVAVLALPRGSGIGRDVRWNAATELAPAAGVKVL